MQTNQLTPNTALGVYEYPDENDYIQKLEERISITRFNRF